MGQLVTVYPYLQYKFRLFFQGHTLMNKIGRCPVNLSILLPVQFLTILNIKAEYQAVYPSPKVFVVYFIKNDDFRPLLRKPTRQTRRWMHSSIYQILRNIYIQGASGIDARFLKLYPASAVSPIMTKFSQYTPHSTCYLVLVSICRQD